ncbi:MAG: PEP/pyruvate-binding domain-containing protein [Paludibacteraceae bacterium]|jgi:CheY-like chemotaxis protein|nr:PEP/pyruvate-binding domain-containing protein [Paludibacteraceae bacterium]
MNKQPNIRKLYFKDTSFANLMNRRIYNVLLVASNYDAFMLEEDGRIDEQIFNEYHSLNLRYPPRFTLVSDNEKALELLHSRQFDLLILMPNSENSDTFETAKDIKKDFPEIPIVVLTPFSYAVSIRLASEDLSAIDYVFSWLGNTDLLLAIIKLLEDLMNVDDDVASVGVQIILLVEDSIRFYSSFLPLIYKFVFSQSRSFMTEALNEHEQMLRMRGRPKVMLARSYEEALQIYNKYQSNILGIISDVSFSEDGVKNKLAGIDFCRKVREKDAFLPIILQSSDNSNAQYADNLRACFVSKNSQKIDIELREAIIEGFGFGDFIFRDPDTKEPVARIKNLRDLQDNIFTIPENSFYYHIARNHVSRWLYSRAMFPLAEFLKQISIEHISDTDHARQIIFDAIVDYRKIKNRGVIAVFERDRFDAYSNFARIGEGSMGGKARGLAFLDAMLKRNQDNVDFENVQITIPRTVVLCTDVFDEFMQSNNLYQIALSEVSDEEILHTFLNASLPKKLIGDLYALLATIKSPIAIRSSSLLEDSHYQPFAGIYSTYMVPFNKESKTQMLMMICEAVKAVYASVFYKDSKAYMTATKNVIDQEKMAIVLQEVVGKQYNTHYYPSFSGVARSLNFYPIGSETAEDGIANIAIGLGKYIVDGGLTLRFSPKHPHNILQTSTLDMALRETQTSFNALDLQNISFKPEVNDGFNLLKLHVKEAETDGALQYIASTFDPYDQAIYDGLYEGGRKVITFANILQHDVFPLSSILETILKMGQHEMGRPVEIEFAVNLDTETQQHHFYLLQIRPIVGNKEMLKEDLDEIPREKLLISSENALGEGITNDIYDIIYIKTDRFNASKNQFIAYEIEKLNKKLQEENRKYILVGPGRWGSSDLWLGIPVKWSYISNAQLIVECGLKNYRIEPSQGTHFFQNLTSFGVGYFTINPFINDGLFDSDFLQSQPALFETEYLRHIRFENPMVIKINGKKSKGVVLKPDK